MKCYIDAGNTRIKWQIGPKAVMQSLAWSEWDVGLDLWVDRLNTRAQGKPVVDRFIIASVVPPARQTQLAETITQHFPHVPVQWIQSRARCCGIQFAYPDMTQFGVDRFCALVAARRRYPRQAVIVINAGTAVTVDYLRTDGVHEGGVIMPSMAAMAAGLNQLAPNLAPFWTQGPQSGAGGMGEGKMLATNTAGALQLGCRWMLASALAQIVEALSDGAKQELAESIAPATVVSGGGATVLMPLLSPTAHWMPDLVMEGIRLAARQPLPTKTKKTSEKDQGVINLLPSDNNCD